MTEDLRRQRSLHCKPGEQATIRVRAAAAGKTVSRYVLDLALADDPDRHPVALTEAEQAELRDRVGEVWIFVRAVKQALAGTGLSVADAIRVLAEREAVRRPARRTRRGAKPNRHMSLSARDSEWAVVSRNAARLGLSKARYLVGLVEKDAAGEDDRGPFVALSPEEQRAQLEAVREVHALMLEGGADRKPRRGKRIRRAKRAPPLRLRNPPRRRAAKKPTPRPRSRPLLRRDRSRDAPEDPEPRQPRLL